MEISVVGIVAIDNELNISSNGKPITFGCDSHIKSLDQAILRSAYQYEHWHDQVVVCMGASTFHELRHSQFMMKIRELGCVLVVSSDKDVEVTRYSSYNETLKSLETVNFDSNASKDKKKTITSAIAYKWALAAEDANKSPKIIVLGGLSVYDMFASAYTAFHVVTVGGPEQPINPKKLKQKPFEMMLHAAKGTLIIGIDGLAYVRYEKKVQQ